MFFQIDDQFQVSPKARALAEAALEGDLTGLAALGLWVMSGSLAQAQLSDGAVSRTDLVRITLNAALADQLAARLIGARLWHGPGHDCPRCPPVAPASFLFHDWFDLGYDRAEQVRTTRRKRKELKDPVLIAEVWARDGLDAEGTRGECRYCGLELKRKDTRSVERWQLEHVDPTKAIGVRNVVLACGPCNRKKGNRMPEQAGMVLRPAPTRSVAAGAAAVISPGTPVAETTPASPTRSVAAGAAAVISPGTPVAETTPASPRIRDAKAGPRPRPDLVPPVEPHLVPDVVPDEIAVPARARPRGRARQGQGGDEVSPRSPQGQRSGNARSRRRGRRGGGGSSVTSAQAGVSPGSAGARAGLDAGVAPGVVGAHHDAGPAPVGVEAPGRFGSPWHGWTGPPSTVTETTCSTHNLEQPCRKCHDEEDGR